MTLNSTHDAPASPDPSPSESSDVCHEARVWRDKGWTAEVVKNEDDDGWAVAMYKAGESEPALVGPWTMGRDKKNPKPLDRNAFNTLVKTADEVLRRHEQQLRALHHKSLVLNLEDVRVEVSLDIISDEFEPHAWLTAHGPDGVALARKKVAASFRLSVASAQLWLESELGVSS